jgi:hypothetical protein
MKKLLVFDLVTSSNPSPCSLPNCEEAVAKAYPFCCMVRHTQYHNALKRYAAFAEGLIFPSHRAFNSQQFDVSATNAHPRSGTSSYTLPYHVGRVSVYFSSVCCRVHHHRHSTNLMVVPAGYSYNDRCACEVMDKGSPHGYGKVGKVEI